jgi:ribonuclease J
VPLIEKALAKAAADGIGDAVELEHMIKNVVARWIRQTHRRSPMIIPVVIDA